MSKSKSAGDLIAELKAHSGVASLRKVGLRWTKNSQQQQQEEEEEADTDRQEFQRVTLRHVNTPLP